MADAARRLGEVEGDLRVLRGEEGDVFFEGGRLLHHFGVVHEVRGDVHCRGRWVLVVVRREGADARGDSLDARREDVGGVPHRLAGAAGQRADLPGGCAGRDTQGGGDGLAVFGEFGGVLGRGVRFAVVVGFVAEFECGDVVRADGVVARLCETDRRGDFCARAHGDVEDVEGRGEVEEGLEEGGADFHVVGDCVVDLFLRDDEGFGLGGYVVGVLEGGASHSDDGTGICPVCDGVDQVAGKGVWFARGAWVGEVVVSHCVFPMLSRFTKISVIRTSDVIKRAFLECKSRKRRVNAWRSALGHRCRNLYRNGSIGDGSTQKAREQGCRR